MSSLTTQTTIINRGLQLLGYKPVGSINANDRGARAMLRAYYPVRDAELRANFWGFSMKRLTLPAGAIAPAFGKNNYFPLPGDYIMLGPPDQFTTYSNGGLSVGVNNIPLNTGGLTYSDWSIEAYPGGGNAIATNDVAPIYIRYVSNALSEGQFDPMFAESFAAALAMDTCEELTQSNTKLANAEKVYDSSISLAKQRNAFESMPVEPPLDSWLTCRL